MDLFQASLREVTEAVQQRRLSAVEVTKFFLDRVTRLNPTLNAFITLNSEAIKEAEEVDRRVKAGEVLKMAGAPWGVKDLVCTKGLRTTAASRMLENFIPPYDATLVKKLKQDGAIILGKLNLDEFAMGSSNETSVFGPVRNPWDLERVPGGSSGGSAAAVAARLCGAAIGTDTGGSIRQPSSLCGIVGLKPTYGRISRYGVIAYASSLDQAGPMANSVDDVALSLETLCGFDEMDGTSAQKPVPAFSKESQKPIKGLRIGVLAESFQSEVVKPEVQSAVRAAMESLKSLGAEVSECSMPLLSSAVPVYYLVATSEASSNLSRYDGVRFGYRAPFENLAGVSLQDFYSESRGQGFGKEVKRRILLGTHCLSSGYYDAYYKKASQVRRLIVEAYRELFQKFDVLLSPVCTQPAFPLGGRIKDPLAMYLNDFFTVSTNLAGLPGMSLPWELSTEGLPIGIQLTGRHFDEVTLLTVARGLEETKNWTGKVPHGLARI